ncbi:para-nitrobenzyl esterase [Siphonobacter sp. BAB-5404]|nr:para-nitrobenzyl esterase [Siphonobacter sp. SORGH_AS_0500]
MAVDPSIPMKKFLLLYLLLLLGLSSFKGPAPVKVDGGLILGSLHEKICIYKGIPFAAPPVGPLRWKAPQAVIPWKGIRKCTQFGPSPMQASPAPFSMWSEEFLIPKQPIREDCLYLNVWTGAQSAQEKRPVLVWIYGGGFMGGGSAVPIYDGEAMAKKGIIFVSINYRVGNFGFFAHPELTQESGNHASGNYGLMDQIAALKWVQRNIRNFGGDPDRVTIAGQSAGSMSVNALVASPQAKGLFKQAIAESGANFTSPHPSLAQAEEAGIKFMHSLEAASLEELRKKPAEAILKMDAGLRGPILDGYILPEPIAQIFASHQQNPVSLLTGWNEEEGILRGPLLKAEDYQHYLYQQYGSEGNAFLRHYPASNEAEATKSQYELARDLIFGVQNYAWANAQSRQGQPVYVYRFTRKVPGTGEYAKYGAFHTGEVAYAYDNLAFLHRPWQSTDRDLARIMSTYWLNFITTGNPNGKNVPNWPLYTTQDKKIINLGKEVKAEVLPDAERLDFLFEKVKK